MAHGRTAEHSKRRLLETAVRAGDAKHDPPDRKAFARLFFESGLDLFCVAGRDGYFKEVNAAWTQVLGYAPAVLRARPFLDFVHPLDREATRDQMRQLEAGAPVIHFENRYRARNGAYHWLEWSARASLADGLIYAVARDVADKRQLEKRLVDLAEDEKLRTSHELHDGICQELSGIAALSTAVSRKLERARQPAAREAREVTRLITRTAQQCRDLAHGLDPVYLEGAGLWEALRELAHNTQHRFPVRCQYRGETGFPHLKQPLGLHLYRIAQEAIANACQHARARRITITLRRRGNEGVLSVTDDGRGLPPLARRGRGLGLRTMQYRTHILGASLQLASGLRGGTEMCCVFSLPPLVRRPA